MTPGISLAVLLAVERQSIVRTEKRFKTVQDSRKKKEIRKNNQSCFGNSGAVLARVSES
jgi:hypothetical protein